MVSRHHLHVDHLLVYLRRKDESTNHKESKHNIPWSSSQSSITAVRSSLTVAITDVYPFYVILMGLKKRAEQATGRGG